MDLSLNDLYAEFHKNGGPSGPPFLLCIWLTANISILPVQLFQLRDAVAHLVEGVFHLVGRVPRPFMVGMRLITPFVKPHRNLQYSSFNNNSLQCMIYLNCKKKETRRQLSSPESKDSGYPGDYIV